MQAYGLKDKFELISQMRLIQKYANVYCLFTIVHRVFHIFVTWLDPKVFSHSRVIFLDKTRDKHSPWVT